MEEKSKLWEIVGVFILAVAFFGSAVLMAFALSGEIAPWVPLAVFIVWITPSTMLVWFVGRSGQINGPTGPE